MYLIDTNILLEFLLDQKRADEVEVFLHTIPKNLLYLSDFSLHSLGVFLFSRKMHKTFRQILDDMINQGGIRVVQLKTSELANLIDTNQKFKLDFDDAYQYAVAEKYNLTIVSFDHDFDKTKLGRKTPAQLTKSA